MTISQNLRARIRFLPATRPRVYPPLTTMPSRSGLLAAGNFIVDHVKIIDCYPGEEMLASILRESSANGGGPYNILKDLAKMGAPFPLAAAGLIGSDAQGRWILDDCTAHGIDTARLCQTDKVSTSYTDAFTVESTGRRTFFHQRGANALLAPEHFDFTGVTARLFYLGYFMLLDTLDVVGSDGRSGASHVLEKADAAGLITAADMVSLEHTDIVRSASSALPYVDHFILNEIEAGNLTGLPLRSSSGLDWQLTEQAARALLERGVRSSVTVHFVEGAVCVEKSGQAHRQSSVQLPAGFVQGATGAGDAFAAGLLLGIHNEKPWDETLRLAVCAAAMCLSHPATSEGMKPVAECLALGETYGFRSFPL
jgi:sugar/nucleoside kinase (ribokinase family)